MGVQLNIFGHRYGDDEPCFLTTFAGDLVYNRSTKQWLDQDSVLDKANTDAHAWQFREVGIPSIAWQLANTYTNGHRWGPSLDDTSGLGSEVVTNGEDWTDAAGAVPPTGWTPIGSTTFQLSAGTLTASGEGMSQVLTMEPDTYYVIEGLVAAGTTGGVRVSIDGDSLPLAPANTDGSSRITAASFKSPSSGTATLTISMDAGAVVSLGFVRCYQEAELTGSGGTIAGTPTPPVNDPITGPYMADDVTFWLNSDNCKIGFNLDTDAEPDVWLTGRQVCRRTSISDAAKAGISAQSVAVGCPALPCME